MRFHTDQNMEIPNEPVIKKLRTGTHPSRTRIVLDLMREEKPSYSWKANGDLLTLTIKDPAPSSRICAKDRGARNCARDKRPDF